jgi:hypothetical protein
LALTAAMHGWLAKTRRLIWWLFLAALPLHVPPCLNGLFEGVSFGLHQRSIYFRSLENYEENTETARELDFYSVPGAPRIHDIGYAPYFVPELRDPNDWWDRIGLVRLVDDEWFTEAPINEYARLDDLYMPTCGVEDPQPWHHWVYLSNGFMHFEKLFLNDWDQAFWQLMQYHYANPPPNRAKFHYIRCLNSFLCDIWKTDGPALLHFTTELLEDEADTVTQADEPGYLPVRARLIQLPRTDDLPLPPGVFPSAFNQLRSITSNAHAWELFPPYAELDQVFSQAYSMIEKLEKRYPRTYGRMVEAELLLKKHLGGYISIAEATIALVREASFLVSWLLYRVVEDLCAMVWKVGPMAMDALKQFIGVPEREEERHGNLFSWMMRDFFNYAAMKMGQDTQAQESAV